VTLEENTITNEKKVSVIMKFIQKIKSWWKNATKVQKSAALILLVAIIGGGAIAVYSFSADSKEPVVPPLSNIGNSDVVATEPEEPKDKALPLTGELVTMSEYADIIDRKVLAVVVENHPDARPQSGLNDADIVFETLVEGGITRFVGIFQSKTPEVVGPVRSVRKYFLDFIAGFGDPLFMHIGGAVSDNPEANALAVLSQRSVKSLGLLNGTSWRVSDRFAPHNAYSSVVQLRETAKDMGWTGSPSLETWKYKDPVSNVENVTAPTINVNWGSWGSNSWSVTWKFDSATNRYFRFHQNEAHIDAVTRDQLTARNVIIMYTPQALANDGTSRIVVDAIGTGKALIFRDGTVIEGQWSKDTFTDAYTFEDAQSNAIPLNRGNSWLMVVSLDSEVTY